MRWSRRPDSASPPCTSCFDRICLGCPSCPTIGQDDGVLVDEQLDPRARFVAHTRQTPWDDFHTVYFAAEALWHDLTAPFDLLRSGVEIEETRPWHADGVIWPAVRVTYPDTFAVPSKQQMLYFDG
ncbi:hypothetical protein ACGFY3_21085 [Streptomyces mirabilis]|uniref:hypothetical protein n=1 Tax=Streptomyces mirabilis TaxID=68239 RepID=UPI00371B355E